MCERVAVLGCIGADGPARCAAGTTGVMGEGRSLDGKGATLWAGGVEELCGRVSSSRRTAADAVVVAIVVVGNGGDVRRGEGELGIWEDGNL